MITEDFKRMLQSIQVTHDQIDSIENYLHKNKAQIDPDMIEYADGTTYYSESYLKLMMDRSYDNGIYKGQQKSVTHIAETIMMPCINCGYKS